MDVIKRDSDMFFKRPLGVGLGNFDGIHIGHMSLINILINECKLNNFHSMIYTFENHPDNIIKGKMVTPLLFTTEKKTEILSTLALDYLFYEKFDEAFSKLEPEEFVKNILIDFLNIKLAVVGFDYNFGYKGRGNADLLKQLSTAYDFHVIVIPPIKVNDDIVSSTLIREILACGDMSKVLYFLGRYYSITGIVQEGNRIGAKLGFPTANIIPEDFLLLPPAGVYATRTLLNGRVFKSVTNIGDNPTIHNGNKKNKINIETHIIGFQENVYNKKIEVFFISKIRDEEKFASKEELSLRIKMDVLEAMKY